MWGLYAKRWGEWGIVGGNCRGGSLIAQGGSRTAPTPRAVREPPLHPLNDIKGIVIERAGPLAFQLSVVKVSVMGLTVV